MQPLSRHRTPRHILQVSGAILLRTESKRTLRVLVIYPAHYLRSKASIRSIAVDAENPALVLPARSPQNTQCESKAAPFLIDDMKAPSV